MWKNFPNLNPFGQFADDVRRMVFQVTADKSWRHRVRGLGLNPELTFDVANNSMISLTPAHPSKRVELRSAHTERDRCLARDTAEATMSCLADELRTRDWRGSARASLMCTRCSRHFAPSSFCVWLVYQVKSLLYVEVLKVAAYFPARCEKQNLVVALWRCRDSWFRKVSQSARPSRICIKHLPFQVGLVGLNSVYAAISDCSIIIPVHFNSSVLLSWPCVDWTWLLT